MKVFVFILLGLLSFPIFHLNPLSAQNFDLTWSKQLAPIISEDLPPGIDFEGLYKAGVEFEDAGGRNFVFFSQMWNRKHKQNILFIHHYRHQGRVVSKVWDHQVFGIDKGPVRLIDKSLRVLDLDKDGFKEISCMYDHPAEIEAIETRLLLVSKGQRMLTKGSIHKNPSFNKVVYSEYLQVYAPVFRKCVAGDWANFGETGTFNMQREWLVNDKGIRIMENIQHGFGGDRFCVWLDQDGNDLYLPKEVAGIISYAKGIKVIEDGADLLVLSTSSLGTISVSTRAYSEWINFADNGILMSDWTWSPQQSRFAFAFALLNSRVYPLDTRIYVLHLDGKYVLDMKKYDRALQYQVTDQVEALPLEFEGEDKLWFVPRL